MFTKILIPSDGSPLSEMAAIEGVDLARKVGAEVTGIFVARESQNPAFDFSPIRPKNIPSAEEYKEAVMKAGDAYLKPIKNAAEEAGLKFSSKIVISNATAFEIVKAAAESGCDLIYMGSHGCAGWSHVLVGTVATRVLQTSTVPVLIYKFRKEQVPPKAMREKGITLPVGV